MDKKYLISSDKMFRYYCSEPSRIIQKIIGGDDEKWDIVFDNIEKINDEKIKATFKGKYTDNIGKEKDIGLTSGIWSNIKTSESNIIKGKKYKIIKADYKDDKINKKNLQWVSEKGWYYNPTGSKYLFHHDSNISNIVSLKIPAVISQEFVESSEEIEFVNFTEDNIGNFSTVLKKFLLNNCNWSLSNKLGYYIARKNDEIYGQISVDDTQLPIKSNLFGINNFYGKETNYVCIKNDKRRTGIFKKLFYYYLNTYNPLQTWLWTTEEEISKKYNSIGFDYLYDQNDDYYKNGKKFYMTYYKCNKIVQGVKDNCVKLTVHSQNKSYIHRGLCGIYVIINALLITYISKNNLGNNEILQNENLYNDLVNKIRILTIDFLLTTRKNLLDISIGGEYLEQINIFSSYIYRNHDIMIDIDKYEHFLINDKLPFNNKELINKINNDYKEQGGIFKFNIWDFIPKFHRNILTINNIYINIDWFDTNIIIVENSFNVDVICNSIFFNKKNINIMKNLYNLNSFIITFIIGNQGHWKCYTVNKVDKELFYYYMDSVPGNNIQNEIFEKIKMSTSYDNYDIFIKKILKCYKNLDVVGNYFNKIIDLLYEESDINKNITIDFLDEFLKTFINRLKLEKLSQRSKDREYIKIREYVRRLDKKYLPIKKLWVNNNILNNYNNLDIDENLEKIDIS